MRRPATRDEHTKYFIVLADMSLCPIPPPSPVAPPYPPYLDWVARTDGSGNVLSVMAAHDFTAATAGFSTFKFDFPGTIASRSKLLAGDILKDLGSVVHTYDQLGSPNPIHFGTYRRVQLVTGGDVTGNAQHEAFGIYSEGPWKEQPPVTQNNTSYNTFWIRTWTADPQWYRVPAMARLG